MLTSFIKGEFNSQYEIVNDNQQRNKRSPPTFWGESRKSLITIPILAGSFALMDRFKGEKQANQREITKNETIEQEKIEGKQEQQQNIFPKINHILMKPPQQSNHNIGKDMLEMVTAGLQKRGVKIPQKAQKVIKKYSKNFQKIGQSSDDVEGQSDPQENVENKNIKTDIEHMNEKEEEIFKQLMETKSKFQQKEDKEKNGEKNGNGNFKRNNTC